MTIKFSPTFMKDLQRFDEPFLILEDRLYTIHYITGTVNPRNFYYFYGRKLSIEESEQIGNLEKLFYLENKDQISSYLTEIIDKEFKEKIKDSADEIEKLLRKKEKTKTENIFILGQDTSIERLITIDIYNAFLNLYAVGDIESVKPTDTIVKIQRISDEEISYPSLKDLEDQRGTSVLDSLNVEGIIAFGIRVFDLQQVDKNEREEYLEVNGKRYVGRYSCLIDKLEDRYQERLKEHIRKKALQHGSRWRKMISHNHKIINSMHHDLEEQKKAIERREKGFTKLNYKKVDNGLYEICLSIDDYIIKKDVDYYLFKKTGKVKVGTHLKVTPSHIQITHKPMVLNMPYYHQFVYGPNNPQGEPEGTICYNGDKEFLELGIDFTPKPIKNLNRGNFAWQVAWILNRARRKLQLGYRGNLTPVKTLNTINFCDEYIGKSLPTNSKYKVFDNTTQKFNRI